jgi:hypothetical protein
MAKSKNASKPKTSRREELLKELRSLIKNIDEEGLQFLIEQSNVILYNMKVDELNKQAEAVEKSRGTGKRAGGAAEETPVEILSGHFGRGYTLVIGNQRKSMDQAEIYAMVKIAHKAQSRAAAAEQLFNWLDRFRDDVIIDCGLKPKGSRIDALYTKLKEQFSLRQ